MASLTLGPGGMHGQTGAGLTPRHAVHYGAALGTYLEGGTVVVGCDSRYASPMLKHAVISTLLGCGCGVQDAGLCPAPVLQFLVRDLGAAGGMVIGGGHHPPGYNALVPIGAGGAALSPVQAQNVLDIYHSQRYRSVPWQAIGKVSVLPPARQEAYLDRLCQQVDAAAIRAAGFTVVADFCNGAGGPLGATFAARLGLRLIPLNQRPNGFLPHDPEPRPRAAAQAQALLAPVGAHVGFVFNSDMTRCGVVADNGETLSEEYTFPLVADQVLRRLGRPVRVVTNTCSTRTLEQVVARHGGEVVKAPVGQTYIIDRMHEVKAALAGEGCGSVALAAHLPAYDGYLTMGLILEAMAQRRLTAAQLAAALDRQYHIRKRRIPCPPSQAYGAVHGLRAYFPEAEHNDVDGLRLDWPEGWVNVRPSATESVIRVIVEWRTEAEARRRVDEVSSLVERQLGAAGR
jgi:phosphomannomutase